MARVLAREDFRKPAWNDIIRRINEIIKNPETGCPEVEPLEEVGPDHKWSKKDIEEVQDKLKEICDENDFDEIPDKWKEKTIRDIEEAIERGWCCCEDDEEQVNTIVFEHPHVWVHRHTSFGCDTSFCPPHQDGDAPPPPQVVATFDYGAFVSGLAPEEGKNLAYSLRKVTANKFGANSSVLASGSFRCNPEESFHSITKQSDGSTILKFSENIIDTVCSETHACAKPPFWFDEVEFLCGPGPKCGSAQDAENQAEAQAQVAENNAAEGVTRVVLITSSSCCPPQPEDDPPVEGDE